MIARSLPLRSPLFTLALLLLACTPARPEAAAPDVVVILVDALRRDRVGTYGHPQPTTPFLDRLAGQGKVYERAYSHSSQTMASTASLLTSRHFPVLVRNRDYAPVPGMHPRRQHDFREIPALARVNHTLSEVFSEAGYETAAFFTNPHHHPTSGFFQGFETAHFLEPVGGDTVYAPGRSLNTRFLEWLDGRGAKQRRPFFAYLHYMDVHHPYGAPKPIESQFVTRKGRYLYTHGVPPQEAYPNEDDLVYMLQLYDASIRHADELIQGVVRALEAAGRMENTLLVVTSDHGDEFLDHGGLGHAVDLEYEMLAVPLLVWGPGVDPGRVSEVASHIDVAPTLLRLSGVPIPEGFQGRPLLGPAPASAADAEDLPHDVAFGTYTRLRSITSERWHFVLDTSQGESQLYDLWSDPRALVAVENPEQDAKMRELAERLEAEKRASLELAKAIDAEELEALRQGVDPAVIEQLVALGYLGEEPEDEAETR